MFYRSHFSLGGTEIAMLNLVKCLEGYDIYISYSNEASDQELLNRFKPYATVINLNETENFEIDTLISCSAHYNLEPAIKNVIPKQTVLWIHHLINGIKYVIGKDTNQKNQKCRVHINSTFFTTTK